jgi:hypothetical protein
VGDPFGFNPFWSTKKPRAAPQKTTKIITGGRTITIKENVEEQPKKKKQNDYGFLDPFTF